MWCKSICAPVCVCVYVREREKTLYLIEKLKTVIRHADVKKNKKQNKEKGTWDAVC